MEEATDVFDIFKSESVEPVSVGNHNFFDLFITDLFQNGLKTLSFRIGSRTNIGDDCVFRKFRRQEFNLCIKVFSLFSRRDSCITDFLSIQFLIVGSVNEISSMTSFSKFCFDFSFSIPFSKCRRRNVKVSSSDTSWYIHKSSRVYI